MAFDLEDFSVTDLDSLIKQANQRKRALKKRKPIGYVRERLTAAAADAGYTISELFGGKRAAVQESGAGRKATGARRGTRKGTKVAPKYRNPANPKETWSGRGLPPRWLAALLKKGKKREDFLIKK